MGKISKGENGSRIETYDDKVEEVGLLRSRETHCCRMCCHRHCRGRCRCRCRVCCRSCCCRVRCRRRHRFCRCVAVVVAAGALPFPSSLLQGWVAVSVVVAECRCVCAEWEISTKDKILKRVKVRNWKLHYLVFKKSIHIYFKLIHKFFNLNNILNLLLI